MPLDHFRAGVADLRDRQQRQAVIHEIRDRAVAKRIGGRPLGEIRPNDRLGNWPHPRFLVPGLAIRSRQLFHSLRRRGGPAKLHLSKTLPPDADFVTTASSNADAALY